MFQTTYLEDLGTFITLYSIFGSDYTALLYIELIKFKEVCGDAM